MQGRGIHAGAEMKFLRAYGHKDIKVGSLLVNKLYPEHGVGAVYVCTKLGNEAEGHTYNYWSGDLNGPAPEARLYINERVTTGAFLSCSHMLVDRKTTWQDLVSEAVSCTNQ